jgi:spore coat assembly protein
MKEIKMNDYVKRKSYNGDIYFKVKEIFEIRGTKFACLKGINVRLIADSPLEDLEHVEPQQILAERHEHISLSRKMFKRIRLDRSERKLVRKDLTEILLHGYYEMPGKVLHLDGDADYLKKCVSAYNMLEVPAGGFYIDEQEMAGKVGDYVLKYSPDIVVLTGHDALKKNATDYMSLDNYKTSGWFIEAIKEIRKIEANRDDLVIIAGACQSNYEAIIKAGANFASSPKRVLIHAFDPVYVAEKIAYTSINEKVDVEEAVENTITGKEGMGGVDTRGHFRLGFPKSIY